MSVLLVLCFSYGILLFPPIRASLGTSNVALPLLLILLGAIFSLATWKAFPNRFLVALFQFVDISLYSAALFALSALSPSPISLYFSAFWIIATVYWATIYAFSVLGFVSLILGPMVIWAAIGPTPVLDMSIGLSAMLWIFVSRITELKRVKDHRVVGMLSALDDAIDKAVDFQRSSVFDLFHIKMIGILHKAKNDLTPAHWNLEYLQQKAQLTAENEKVLVDTKECIVLVLEDMYRYLEKYRAQMTEANFYNLSDLISDVQGRLTLFPDLQMGVEYPEDLLLEGRLDDVRLALTTLIENSVDAGASNLSIQGFKSSDGSMATLVLKDDGPGLPDGVKARLFKPFNTFGKRKGVGLGLYLAYRLTAANGGQLTLVESLPTGTTFSLHLALHTPLHEKLLHKKAIH